MTLIRRPNRDKPSHSMIKQSASVELAKNKGWLCDDALWAAGMEAFARKNGKKQPDGTWNNLGWEPSDEEWCVCCDDFRSPSERYPHGLRQHCRTVKHVAELMCADLDELRKLIKYFQIGMQAKDAIRDGKPWIWSKKSRLQRHMALSLMICDGFIDSAAAETLLPAEEQPNFRKAIESARNVSQIQDTEEHRTNFLMMFDQWVWQSQQTVGSGSEIMSEVLAEIMSEDILENAFRIKY